MSTSLFSQSFSISGTVQSAEDGLTFPGASVVLQNPSDSSMIKGSVTDFDGNFKITEIKAGAYLIKIGFVGFESLYQKVELKKNLDLGKLLLKESTKMLDEIQVVGKPIAAMQKGDTAQFNAGAYKTTADASAQDLVEKIPGINMQDGKLQANGEDVQVILVDGKPFFGGDVKAALQNLPAEVIASIQIFDKKSDKAAMSGFDDGEQQKTINIVTKPNRRRGEFGKATVGIGDDKAYQAGSSVNFFNNDRRVTVTGISNNINMIDYSADPNTLGENRVQNGQVKTNNIGVNFSEDLSEKLEVHASYQFSRQENQESQNKFRDYAVASDSGQVYKQESYVNRVDALHRFSFKIEYKIDENNRFIMRPNLKFDNERVNDDFSGITTSASELVNSTENSSVRKYKDYDYDNNLYYSHKFNKKGRSLTTGIHTGWHTNEDFATRYAENYFYSESDSVSIIDQQTTLSRTGISWSVNTSYTEPVGEHSMMELEYKIGNRIDDSDKLTFDIDESMKYARIDTALSNTFESQYLRQSTELGYQYKFEKIKFQVEAEYQVANMENQQEFPKNMHQNRVFKSVLPSARINYEISEDKRVEFNYHTWTNEPSVGDLQDVINNSNPLQLRAGNPDLNQTYYHWGRARYWFNNEETGKSIYASVESSFAKDLVTNATFIAEEQTEVADGIILEEGSQLTRPANVDGYYYVRSYMSYGKPLESIKSNIYFRGGMSYYKRPGLINDQVNYSNTSKFGMGVSLNSNISENLDFNISTGSSYNVAQNSLRPTLNNNFYNHTTNFKYRWVFLDGFVYRANVRHQLNTGLSAGYDNSSLLFNMSAGKKFLKDDLAEISINVYDLLKQNNNANRNITELYVEDSQSTVLQRYFMLTFTYNIRHFSAGTTKEDFKDVYEL
ncbi:TonB-dependent receptor [Reichenbachiella sp. MALMAid0571]|uniref:TonB-dependent receptor n=1 Tax=Reichenbachiella sp. MALMAid0571 TaxID=3143939 RepID=UPI0032E03D62